MTKEMYIASSPHETKVAVLEDEQLVEIYYERDSDVGMAGSIYKGRVSRVLPGMQSAFVDIGLERDAFLYVSDFYLEDQDEFDNLLDGSESRIATVNLAQPPSEESGPEAEVASSSPTTEEIAPLPSEKAAATESGKEIAPPARESAPPPGDTPPAGPPQTSSNERPPYRRGEHHGRRRRRWSRSSEPRRFGAPRTESAPAGGPANASAFEVLPGESLAKHPLGESTGEPEAVVSDHEGVQGSEPAAHENAQPEVSPAQPIVPPAFDHAEPRFESRGAVSGWRAKAEEDRAEEPEQPMAITEPEPFAGGMPIRTGPRTDMAEDTVPEGAGSVEAVANETATEVLPAAVEAASGEGATAEPGVASESRDYTLRESQVQPRFAPRRGRRGRRRGGRSQGRPAPARKREGPRSGNNQPVQINELLHQGQEILVQIAKEPLGTKGARITSHIALPARYLVYMPTISHIGISRKIANEQERLRLRNFILENRGPLTGGFIVRTAGDGRSEAELHADLKFLTTLWTDIRSRAEASKAPALIYRDLDLVQRLLRDLLTPDFKAIRVDTEAVYTRVLDFVNNSQPSLVNQVKLHTRPTPLYEEFGVQAEVEKALKPKVWLKSGGYIVINQTEALVAIDVNTGKYVGKTNRLEDTILKTNIDAVNEIVRQVRLRDLGGIIVIDFIDMDERRNRNKVIQAMEEALAHDRAPTRLLSFNDFGLVAITRKRVKQSLERTLCDPCPYCNASGWVKSATTVCNEILAETQKMARSFEGRVMNLRVNPEVSHALRAHGGALINEMESLTQKEIVIKSDPSVHQERFEIF